MEGGKEWEMEEGREAGWWATGTFQPFICVLWTLIYGHTHTPYQEVMSGVGFIFKYSPPSFGLITVYFLKIMKKIKFIS